jgi:general L-amino acid transport system permease protein
VLAMIPLGTQAQMVMALAVVMVVAGYVVGLVVHFPNRLLLWAWILSLPFTFIMLQGGIYMPVLGIEWSFAPYVDSTFWGGLMLTMLLSVVGIVLSFPLGILLALGRRSYR